MACGLWLGADAEIVTHDAHCTDQQAVSARASTPDPLRVRVVALLSQLLHRLHERRLGGDGEEGCSSFTTYVSLAASFRR